MDQRPPSSAYVAAVGMTVAFALSFVATKTALKGFEPLLIALLRFALAGAILWVVWRLRPVREPLTRAELGRLALIGFVSLTVYFSFENLGLARTSASEAAILIATIPIFVALIGAFVPAERPSGRQWAGILLSFAGIVALVLAAGGAGGGSLTGNLLVLAASVSGAAYAILARRLLVSRSALFVTAYQNLFGALFMAPLALVEALVMGVRRPTAQAAGGVLFLTLVCSILAYLLLNYAFRFLPASRVSVFINLTPVVAVASAYVLLGERLTVAQGVAAAGGRGGGVGDEQRKARRGGRRTGEASRGSEVHRQDEVALQRDHDPLHLVLEVAAHHLVGLAGERLGAEVELAVELLDGGATQAHLAPGLALGAAEDQDPAGRAGAVPVDGVDEVAAAHGAHVRLGILARGAAARSTAPERASRGARRRWP